MFSLYDDLSKKIEQAPGIARRNGARQDLGLVLFAEREALNDLWKAAERCAPLLDADASAKLREAIEQLRALFGERAG